MKVNSVILAGVALCLLSWARRQKQLVTTHIVIHAPPERVWTVLTDAARYPEWNPVMVNLKGEFTKGQTIGFENRSGARSMRFRPTVLVADHARELRWLGQLWLPGLADGEHFFLLEALPGARTCLTHGEEFTGLLIPLTRSWLKKRVSQDLQRINSALKAFVEAQS